MKCDICGKEVPKKYHSIGDYLKQIMKKKNG